MNPPKAYQVGDLVIRNEDPPEILGWLLLQKKGDSWNAVPVHGFFESREQDLALPESNDIYLPHAYALSDWRKDLPQNQIQGRLAVYGQIFAERVKKHRAPLRDFDESDPEYLDILDALQDAGAYPIGVPTSSRRLVGGALGALAAGLVAIGTWVLYDDPGQPTVRYKGGGEPAAELTIIARAPSGDARTLTSAQKVGTDESLLFRIVVPKIGYYGLWSYEVGQPSPQRLACGYLEPGITYLVNSHETWAPAVEGALEQSLKFTPAAYSFRVGEVAEPHCPDTAPDEAISHDLEVVP